MSTTPRNDTAHPRDGEPVCQPVADHWLLDLDREHRGDRRALRWAVLLAVVFHAGLLAVTFPEVVAELPERDRPTRVYFVNQTRFRPPPPPAGQPSKPQRRAKKIPIPDPTPLDPEPIEMPEIEIPEFEMPEIDTEIFGIPGPPSDRPGAGFGDGDGPVQLGAGISPPLKIHAPAPPYTESARLARITGAVILNCVIDREGRVAEVKVLKGLPHGLDVSAVETVRQWRFRPALRDGEPIAVYFSLVVNFRLQ